MACKHHHLGAPVLQSNKSSHTNFVYPGHTHTVISVKAPFVVRLRSSWVIHLITLLVVSLLETDDPVETVVAQFGILLCCERHHLNLQVVEVRFCQV